MIIGANLRFGGSGGTTNGTRTFNCPASSSTEASLLYLIAVLGVVTNVAVMLLILGRATLRRFPSNHPSIYPSIHIQQSI
uniref:Uncharacterized protein n=1 Tax=Daphnia galeata TaxID=27404 RepID=A0A8J2S977_9CRUS|nr:unnamed protein product [Daphnia galeata]